MAHDDRLVEILGDLLEARDRGRAADLAALTASHPDLADEIRRHLRLADVVTGSTPVPAAGDPDGAEEAGEPFGRYRLLREIGHGGMGTVHLATRRDGARVALKILHPHLIQTEGFFKRFLREAEVGRRIVHENVVRTLDFDALTDQGRSHHFLVMEYVEGKTLRELLEELGPLPEELCLHIAREVCKGLAAIHAAGAVHRDLKPENVIVATRAARRHDDVAEGGASSQSDAGDDIEHVVKIMDLGVARLVDETVRLSRTGAFVGSVHYAAPEQFQDVGGGVDGRADLYALGLVLYEISSGEHPFVAEGVARIVGKILHETPRRLGDLNPQVSSFFEELVHTLVAKDREDRFATPEELLTVLEQGERSAWWRARSRVMRLRSAGPLRRIQIPRETAVYGREQELVRLRALYDRAAGGAGQVVLIEGEAGVGKTRLLDEMIARLRRAGEDVSFLYGSYPPGGAAASQGAFSTAFREHVGEVGAAPLLAATPLLAPAFEAVLRGEPSPTGTAPLSREALTTCFVNAARALARERTTVLLIDDLHFAPQDARDLFTSLALAVPEHRVLLIGTSRPGLPQDWIAHLTRLEHTTPVPLDRLSPKDLALLLRDSFRSERLAEELGYKIALKSDGNPFFAFEIIRGLREGQFITQEADGTWVSTRVIDELRIPSTILDLVNARVAELDDDDRNLLDVASCWGYEFDAILIGEVLGMARVPVLQRFARIEKRDRLVRASGRLFVFDHHQVQEALYDALPEVLREEYHAALADALEERVGAATCEPRELAGDDRVRLCEHLLAGGHGARAGRYLDAALEHLQDAHLHAQAVSLARRALDVPDLLRGVERADVLTALCGAYRPLDMLGRRDLQIASAHEAEQLAAAAGDDARRSRAAFALATALWRVGRNEEAEAALRRSHELDPQRGEPATDAAFASQLAGVVGDQGRLEEALRLHAEDLELSRAAGDRRGEGRATGNLGRVYLVQGRLDEARDHVDRCLEISREIGNREGEAIATGNLGAIAYAQGRLEDSRALQEQALVLCREIGDRLGEARAAAGLGNVLAGEGRLEEARASFERSAQLCRETGYRKSEAAATMNLGTLLQTEGRLQEALESYERALEIHSSIANRPSVAIAHFNAGSVLLEMGADDEADERLQAALDICEELGLRLLHAETLLVLGVHRARARGVGEGRALLERARDVAHDSGQDARELLARCALATLPGGDVADAITAFEHHGDALDDGQRREAAFLLWQATGERRHLDDAKRLLDELLATVPQEHRESVAANTRLHREIQAAWRTAAGTAGDGDDAEAPS